MHERSLLWEQSGISFCERSTAPAHSCDVTDRLLFVVLLVVLIEHLHCKISKFLTIQILVMTSLYIFVPTVILVLFSRGILAVRVSPRLAYLFL